jgi:hypothetical protein
MASIAAHQITSVLAVVSRTYKIWVTKWVVLDFVGCLKVVLRKPSHSNESTPLSASHGTLEEGIPGE